MHISLLFLLIWQVPMIRWSDEIMAVPAQSHPARFRGLIALAPCAGIVLLPEYNKVPLLDHSSMSMLAVEALGFWITNHDLQLLGSFVSVKSG
jgi:hypothetical protein